MNSEQIAPPKYLLLIASGLQGLALFALYRSMLHEAWPSTSPAWSYPLWTVSILLPLFFLLSCKPNAVLRAVYSSALAVIPFGLAAGYIGLQSYPVDAFTVFSLQGIFIASIALASFKALNYLQLYTHQQPLNYSFLFSYSWRNVLILFLSHWFILLLALILSLWGVLFSAIGIDFFLELYVKDWFFIPLLCVAVGFAILHFKQLQQFIDNITRLLHGLAKSLLPLLFVFALAFLTTLPFVGLQTLWSTGNGTSLLLSLLALSLLLTNMVYQDGQSIEFYSRLVHRGIAAGLFVLPVIAGLAVYGLSLRVNQHGWSVERGWAALITALLTITAAGYAAGVLKRRDAWPTYLARVNAVMGAAFLTALLLANSPVLDFRKISVSSQLARLDSKAIDIAQLDIAYFANTLARPGFDAIASLRIQFADSRPELFSRLNYRSVGETSNADATFELWNSMIYSPANITPPFEVRELIENTYSGLRTPPLLVEADLNNNGTNEYVLIAGESWGQVYYQENGGWLSTHLQGSRLATQMDYSADSTVKIIDPQFKDIEVNGIRFSPGLIE